MAYSFSRLFLTLLALLLLEGCAKFTPGIQSIRLYALDGGTIDVSDMADFSRRGLLDGERITLANPSFLIRHPRGVLLWDSGNSDALVDYPEGRAAGVYLTKLERTLVSQLLLLRLRPKDIDYLSLSHLHPDHAGNANLFSESTFIVNKDELDYMLSEEARESFGEYYEQLLSSSKIRAFSNSYDVFGDGTVVIISSPGHTPGSSVLLLKLANAGSIILTGDLYAHRRARELNTIPVFNLDPAKTLESRLRFEALAERENARVIIQHSMDDFKSLPTFPDYLN